MNLYRIPQHLMLIPAFLTPLLLTYAYDVILKLKPTTKKANHQSWGLLPERLIKIFNPESHKQWIYYVFLLIILIWISGWWSGDLGQATLTAKGKDHADFYQLSPGMAATYKLSEDDKQLHRILVLPAVHSPIYLSTSYQNSAQGGQPEYMYLRNPTFREEGTQMAKLINRHFCDLENMNWINIMGLLNIKYVTVRSDILPKFSDCFERWDSTWVAWELSQHADLKKLIEDEYVVTYQVNEKHWLPRIYIPTQINYYRASNDHLPELVSRPDFQLGNVLYLNSDSDKQIMLENLPRLEFKQVSPVKYQVVIKAAKDDFHLVFSENFNQQWKVYLKKPEDLETKTQRLLVSHQIYTVVQNENLNSGNFWDSWFKLPVLQETNHLQANGYANSWIIKPDNICSKYSNYCVKNSDGTIDMHLIIEYQLQRYFYFGIMITLLSIGGLLVFGVVNKKRNL